MALTDHDHQMIQYAMRRGEVIVRVGDRARLATLLSWRPRHHGKHSRKARVQFPRGTYAHVPIDSIEVPLEH